ncbi:FHA domain-containing protein [Hydrogenimonas sp.]
MPNPVDKLKIKNTFIPKAALVAQTAEAAAAVPIRNKQDQMIAIWDFPFLIGRESRLEISKNGELLVKERFKHSFVNNKTNDLYLVDFGKKLQISREHLLIEQTDDGRYYILDRGSKCGSEANGTRIGSGTEVERTEIKDGDTIILGTPSSPYRYIFVVLTEEDDQKA